MLYISTIVHSNTSYLFSSFCDNNDDESDNSAYCSDDNKNSGSNLELGMDIFCYCICILIQNDMNL